MTRKKIPEIIQLKNGASMQDDIVLLPYGCPVGLRGDQSFVPLWGQGYLVEADGVDAEQRELVGLPPKVAA